MYFVYMMSNKSYGTLYVGVTNDLPRRTFEHRNSLAEGFTKRHGLHRLVWYEAHDDVTTAITREKLIKKWRRDWKVNLIQSMNPNWLDLYETII